MTKRGVKGHPRSARGRVVSRRVIDADGVRSGDERAANWPKLQSAYPGRTLDSLTQREVDAVLRQPEPEIPVAGLEERVLVMSMADVDALIASAFLPTTARPALEAHFATHTGRAWAIPTPPEEK